MATHYVTELWSIIFSTSNVWRCQFFKEVVEFDPLKNLVDVTVSGSVCKLVTIDGFEQHDKNVNQIFLCIHTMHSASIEMLLCVKDDVFYTVTLLWSTNSATRRWKQVTSHCYVNCGVSFMSLPMEWITSLACTVCLQCCILWMVNLPDCQGYFLCPYYVFLWSSRQEPSENWQSLYTYLYFHCLNLYVIASHLIQHETWVMLTFVFLAQ